MGTYVSHDPASLRHAAAQLQQRAGVFREIAGQVEVSSHQVVVVGPAGDRFRNGISTTGGQLRGTCDRIAEVAGRLLREADRIEDEMRNVGRMAGA